LEPCRKIKEICQTLQTKIIDVSPESARNPARRTHKFLPEVAIPGNCLPIIDFQGKSSKTIYCRSLTMVKKGLGFIKTTSGVSAREN
jgi:hypothetical protein